MKIIIEATTKRYKQKNYKNQMALFIFLLIKFFLIKNIPSSILGMFIFFLIIFFFTKKNLKLLS